MAQPPTGGEGRGGEGRGGEGRGGEGRGGEGRGGEGRGGEGRGGEGRGGEGRESIICTYASNTGEKASSEYHKLQYKTKILTTSRHLIA